MRAIYLEEETGDFAFSKSDVNTIAEIKKKNKSDVNTMGSRVYKNRLSRKL